jgi:hypothetical protein
MNAVTELRLLMFAPCERVVIGSEGDNSSSLIAILQGFIVNESELPMTEPAEGAPVPTLPQPWYAFSLWENDFSGRTFKQRIELRNVSGRVLVSADSEMTGMDKKFHRVSIRLPGFPLVGLGDYQLVLWLQVDGGEFVERARFPIPIKPKKA